MHHDLPLVLPNTNLHVRSWRWKLNKELPKILQEDCWKSFQLYPPATLLQMHSSSYLLKGLTEYWTWTTVSETANQSGQFIVKNCQSYHIWQGCRCSWSAWVPQVTNFCLWATGKPYTFHTIDIVSAILGTQNFIVRKPWAPQSLS